MKILQRGRNLRIKVEDKPMICPSCGCIFLIDNESDLNFYPFMANNEEAYIDCPNLTCRFSLKLSNERITKLKTKFPHWDCWRK